MQNERIGKPLLWLAMLPVAFAAQAGATGQTRADRLTPDGVSAAFLACKTQARGAVEQAACIAQERTAQDKRLNRVYRQLLAALDAHGKAKLLEAERAWLQSADKDGNLEAALYGETQVENLEADEAALFRLCARADQLEHYLRLVD